MTQDGYQEISDVPVPLDVFSDTYKTCSVPALRHIRFESVDRQTPQGPIQANGFGPAFVTLGRRVLVRPRTFFQIIERNSE